MGKEFELKYTATPEILAAVRQELDGIMEISMETTYYDTFDKDLSARHMTLRRRFENGLSVCTLKAPDGANRRKEWEVKRILLKPLFPYYVNLATGKNWKN